MVQWNIRINGVLREPFDKAVYLQAVLTFCRQLLADEQAKQAATPASSEQPQADDAAPETSA